jgi:hypothetical protein
MNNYILASLDDKNDISFNLGNVTYTTVTYVDDTKTAISRIELYFCDGKSVTIDDQNAIELIMARPNQSFKYHVFRYNLTAEDIKDRETEISTWLAENHKDIIDIKQDVYGKHRQWMAVSIFYLDQT